jgi:HSP20 family protein
MSEQTKEFEIEKEEVATPEGVESTRPGRTYVPRVDIYENAKGIWMRADLPGVDENGLDLTLEKNVLTLDAQTSMPWPKGYDLAHVEYETGNYHRAFKLSEAVDQDNIEATIKNGVLKLHMPYAPDPQKRQIEVQAA